MPLNHGLYIAAFAPGVMKVGVSKWNRTPTRLAEQGARAGLIVARDDGQLIRRTEDMIKSLGIKDKINHHDKLRSMSSDVSLESLYEELDEVLKTLKRRMRAQWVDPQRVDLPIHPTLPHTRMMNTAGLSIHGAVEDTVGQLIVLKDEAGEYVAIDGSSLVGRYIDDLDKEESSNYQMSLLAN